MSKKLTNKQKCRNCIHKSVCKYFGIFDDMDDFGWRCEYYFSKNRAYKKKGADHEQKDRSI